MIYKLVLFRSLSFQHFHHLKIRKKKEKKKSIYGKTVNLQNLQAKHEKMDDFIEERTMNNVL